MHKKYKNNSLVTKYTFLFFISIFFGMPFFVSAGVCESDTVTDIEGNAYNTVEIGNQCWMQENLNVGTPIGSFESDGTTLNPQTDNATIEKYCYGYSTHGDAGQLATGEANCDTYGGLYQWDEAMQYEIQEGTQGICPVGWHIPTDDEWKTLEMHLGMDQATADIIGWRGTDEGDKLKELSKCTGGTNCAVSNFEELLAGNRSTSGSLNNLGLSVRIWSSSESGSNAWRRLLSINRSDMTRYAESQAYGFSVRCLQNITPVITPQNTITKNNTTFTLSGTVTDTGNTIASLEYRLNPGTDPWTQCSSDDGVFDEKNENFTCTLENPSEGERTIFLRSTNSIGLATGDTEIQKTFTVDTTNPTLTNTSTQTLHYDTNSSTLIFTSDEDSTCRYSTNENDSWNDMTPFQTTGATSHETPIDSLDQGKDYTYSIHCRDQWNNESQQNFTITVAPKEEDRNISDSSFQTENEENSTKQKKDKTLYFTKEGITMEGKDSSLAKGRIKVYFNNRRIKTIDVEENGEYESEFDIKHGKDGTLKLKYYDQYGTRVKTERQEIHVDKKKPKFTTNLPKELTLERDQRIDFPTIEKDTGIDFYKVRLEPVRGWRKQDESFYYIPQAVPNGAYRLYIRTCDKADNCTQENIKLTVIDPKSKEPIEENQKTQEQGQQTQQEVQGVEASNTKDLQEEQNPFAPSGRQSVHNETLSNTLHSSNSCQRKWWNPFTWECEKEVIG